MSQFEEVHHFPWLPIFITLCTLVIVGLIIRWGFQYAKFLWFSRASHSRHHHSKKKKKKKRAKYSDSDSSSESSEDSY